MSFACSSPAGGMLFGVSGLLLLLLLNKSARGIAECKRVIRLIILIVRIAMMRPLGPLFGDCAYSLPDSL